MKRAVAIVLALLISICLVSCKKESKKGNKSTDVSYYANLGEIPECTYKIGDDAKKASEEFEKKMQESENEDNYYELIEGEETSKIFTYKAHYIYNNDSNKITEIICFDKAFGFELGTDKDTIVNSQTEYGQKGNEVTLTEDEAKEFSGTDLCVYVEYEFDKHTVIFAFENNCLFATKLKINGK